MSCWQWLVTKRARNQWERYKAMLDDAKNMTSNAGAGITLEPQGSVAMSGTSFFFFLGILLGFSPSEVLFLLWLFFNHCFQPDILVA